MMLINPTFHQTRRPHGRRPGAAAIISAVLLMAVAPAIAQNTDQRKPAPTADSGNVQPDARAGHRDSEKAGTQAGDTDAAEDMPADERAPGTSAADDEPFDVVVPHPRPVSDAWKRFSELPVWEDGYSEMSYYDATCVIYDKKREYTRVHLMNRQEMDARHFIKASEHSATTVPVFKFIISEEVPTENYNYRFHITTFQLRPGLEPFKVSVSSQDWCGTTFKYLLWWRQEEFDPKDWALDIVSNSYFPTEGDRWNGIPGGAYIDPYEGLFLFARAVVASGGKARPMKLLRSLRSNKAANPEPLPALLRVDGDPRKITVPLGTLQAQRVVLVWEGEPTWFDVETKAPYRLLSFKAGDVEAKLKFVERGAYWDRDWSSKFYKPGHAP